MSVPEAVKNVLTVAGAGALSALCACCEEVGPPDTDGWLYQWHAFYGGIDQDDGASLTVDGDGNVYATGRATTTWSGPDGQDPLQPFHPVGSNAFVLKLGSDGAYLWHAFYGRRSSGDAVTIDGSGGVYVTGSSSRPWSGPDGQDPLNPYTEGGDLSLDAHADAFVLKLDSSGAYQWHTFYGNTGEDYGGSLDVDGSGDIYVAGMAGSSWDGPDGQSPLDPFSAWWDDLDDYQSADAFVLKLDSSGAYEWHAFYGSKHDDGGGQLRVDGSGDVYVAGYSEAPWDGPGDQSPLSPHSGWVESGNYHSDAFVLKLDPSGAYRWHAFYESGGSIAIDGSGNIYVAGMAEAPWDGPDGQSPLNPLSADCDVSVLKLGSDGAYLWHTFFGGEGSEGAHSIRLDGSGNPYLTGSAHTSWDGPDGQSPLNPHAGGVDEINEHCSDIFVLKLDSSGAYEWHSFYGSRDYDGGSSLDVDGGGNVYVTGYSGASWKGHDGQRPLRPHSRDGEAYGDAFVLKLTDRGAP